MYAGLQSVWWAGTYMICYRYQPTVLIMRTGWGSRAVHWVGGWLQRVGAARLACLGWLALVGAGLSVWPRPW